jgi:hypothetical protein
LSMFVTSNKENLVQYTLRLINFTVWVPPEIAEMWMA